MAVFFSFNRKRVLFFLFSDTDSALSRCGFSDWKNAAHRFEEHETAQVHRNAILTWLARTQAHGIDNKLKEQCMEEANYWQEILKRVVFVIKFLAERGLPFRGG